MPKKVSEKFRQRHGSGHHKPKVSDKVRDIATKLVEDPQYNRTLLEKLRDGTCHPSVISMLYYYAYGKPKEELDLKQPVPVRIVHEYAGSDGTE